MKNLRSNPKGLVSDITSGLATGLFSIPEGMAYAQLAGVNPVYGLYSGIVATIVSSMSTGTILMISTLTSAIALSTASVIQTAGIGSGQMPAALFTITFLVGVTMFILGLLRLGVLVSFVSNAVMTGFVVAASLLIIIGEMGDFSGYDPSGANKLAEMANWFLNFDQWDLATTLVGVVTVVIMVVLKRIKQTEKMAAIITLVFMSVAVYLLNLDSVALVGSIATIPSSLPTPMLPDFSLISKLALGSVSVALVALVQGAGISTAYPNPDGRRSDQSRDFIGEGLGNLVGSFFQSMGTGGSLSRTGISVGAGAKSRLGGVFAGLWLALIVVLLGSLAESIPLTVIAGMLFVIGAELILARVPDAKLVWYTSRSSTAAGLLTFLSALFIPLQYTIFLGAGLSLLVYVYTSSKDVRVVQLVRDEAGKWQRADMPKIYPANEVTVVFFEGIHFFAEIPTVKERIPAAQGSANAVVVWRFQADSWHPSSTMLKWVQGYIQELQAGGNVLILTDLSQGSMQILERTGLLDLVGRENVFPAEDDLQGALIKAVQAAQTALADQNTDSSGSVNG